MIMQNTSFLFEKSNDTKVLGPHSTKGKIVRDPLIKENTLHWTMNLLQLIRIRLVICRDGG